MASVVVMGALDTKGAELQFVKDQIEARGHKTLVVDSGVLGEPPFTADIPRAEVASAAGASLADLVARNDRGTAVSAMSKGAEAIARRLLEQGRIDGIIAMGGGAGTSVGTAAMRALPLGIPKVMVSTLASSDVRGYVGVKDIMMVPAIVDISGLNRISRGVFTRAAAAICGMVEARVPEGDDKPLITASMFGNTTKCVEAARAIVEREGYEVLIFHAVGVGGQTMESLIDAGMISGVLDVTLTEWADELAGGVLSAGPHRLDAAPKTGTPAVYAPGCLDIINFWGPETIPEKYRNSRIYKHNERQYLVRTNVEESAELGRIIAGKLNQSVGPAAVYVPLQGISVISSPGGPYHWPEADAALFEALRTNLRKDIPYHELDLNINDPEFARAMADGLLDMGLRGGKARPVAGKGKS
jgi:uncharacterized protein (UPF0261 family)